MRQSEDRDDPHLPFPETITEITPLAIFPAAL